VREVRCLSDDTLSSEGCDEQLRPVEREDCNPEPCIPGIGQSSPHILWNVLCHLGMLEGKLHFELSALLDKHG